MNAGFKNVPVESDTKIRTQKMIRIGDIDVLYQKWYWDGIVGESIIFIEDDIKDLNDSEMIALAMLSEMIGH